ncbi:ubiquitin-conjugating enzyme E2 [Plasmodium brasilianum]|uniref:Ubiquitin-conjugating enzyme E2, putative n=2 Tax=Plasmodium (Plasmodium) TaxID=418103 RepID=A0A1C3L0D2_PLAMA|nr:ubiquitin-conjugating enzyme E2, putative [Plasmodium malariae]KAI4836342.1 ubiquitin-conjugating enzyme E2 [Plasmodium brasilianum]SBT79971.1 ubiquitin-conjugating enzyme E2, putative [Plasmodium malariae]SCO93606.1 ubiquitin-conjugating enzyme E2, putative [Plasmodium malariae]
MKKVKVLKSLIIICYMSILTRFGNKNCVKCRSFSCIPKYGSFTNHRNKYINFMIKTKCGTKKEWNKILHKNPVYYLGKSKYLINENVKKNTKRLFTIQPNKPVNCSTLKPSTCVQKHIRTKYNLGNANYRIQKELHNFLKNPPINCTIDVHPNNIRIWIVTYTGLENTIYANEIYKIKIIFSDDYPLKPPTVYFLQKPPKHTHVYSNGDICLSLLGDDYNPSLSISGLILSIISMLSSAKEKKLPIDNYTHADAKPGSSQNNFLYHDDKC